MATREVFYARAPLGDQMFANVVAWGPAAAGIAVAVQVAAGAVVAQWKADSFWLAVTLLLTPVAVSAALGVVPPARSLAERWHADDR